MKELLLLISVSDMMLIADSLTSTEGDHGEIEEKLAKVSEASHSPSLTDDPPPIPTPAYLQKHHHSIVLFLFIAIMWWLGAMGSGILITAYVAVDVAIVN